MRKGLGTVVWSLILIGLGILFLLGNFFPEFRPWRLFSRYWSTPWLIFARFWPSIIILWGISKLESYFRGASDAAVGQKSRLSSGDIVLLIFLLVFGSAATGITRSVRGSISLDSSSGESHLDEFGPFASGPRFQFTQELKQPLSGPAPLEVSNEYGDLEFFAHDLPELKVKLTMQIRADDERGAKEVADRIRILIDSQEKGYHLSSNRGSLQGRSRRGLRTNFAIWVPKSTSLAVGNRFGSVILDGVSGGHRIVNGNGPVTIRNVDGSVQVANKYGPVTVSNITGECKVDNKFGSIELDGIGGRVDAENAYGPVDLKGLDGSVKLSNRYGQVQCQDLGSSLFIDAQYAAVKALNILGDAEIETSYKSIDLENVLGKIMVRGKHGDIKIKNDKVQVKPITVETEYSGVDIVLPRESSFQFEARSRYGRFSSGFESVNVSEFGSGKDVYFRGTHGQGGPMIKVSTTYRDISLDPL